jgi:transcriptional regulator with XRE-family HTH domain
VGKFVQFERHGLARLREGPDLLSEIAPINVGAQFLAGHALPCICRRPFDGGTVLCRHPVLEPGLNSLMTVVLDVQGPSSLDGAAEDRDRSLSGDLAGSLCFHPPKSTQEKLVLLESLAFTGNPQQETLAGMSIHTEIKRLRLAKGWSHQRLADEITKLEQPKKPISWQTVQQWEKTVGGTAPKRSRMEYVARALGVPVQDLVVYSADGSVTIIELKEADPKPYPAGLAPDEVALIEAYREILPEQRADAAYPLLARGNEAKKYREFYARKAAAGLSVRPEPPQGPGPAAPRKRQKVEK